MKTVTIQIGNTDDKLTQAEWARFVARVKEEIASHCCSIHFFGASSNWESWQNAAWIVSCEDDKLKKLKDDVSRARHVFRQDSAAWTEGEMQFV